MCSATDGAPAKDDAAAANPDNIDPKDLPPYAADALSSEDQAGILSSWLLLYLTPLLKLGATKPLETADVGPPSKADRAMVCHAKVNDLWVVEVARVRELNAEGKAKHEEKLGKLSANATLKQRKKIGTFVPTPPNLAKVLWNAFGYWQIWLATFLYVIAALIQFMPVLILNDLVGYFESPNPSEYKALLFHPWGNVVGLFVFPLIVSLLQTRSQVILNHCAIFIRTSVSTLLFSKALTITRRDERKLPRDRWST